MTAVTPADDVRQFPPVAGISFRYTVQLGVRIATPDLDNWAGSSPTPREVVISVDHVLGDCSAERLIPIVHTPPWSTFYRNERGEILIRFHDLSPKWPAQLLVPIVPGLKYEIRYSRPPSAPVNQRDKELALITLVLATRALGILAHGCGFLLDGERAVLCPGISGAGKSTLARLLDSANGETRAMNDDRILLTDDDSAVRAWGTPWPGQGGIARPLDGRLVALAFIRHGQAMCVRQVAPLEAARRLYQTLSLPLWNGTHTAEALDRVDRLVMNHPLLEFTYPPTVEAAQWITAFLRTECQ